MRELAVVVLGLIAIVSAHDIKAEDARIDVELNKLEPVDAACRAYLVFENRTDIAFNTFKLDLVMFDTENVIAKRVAVEAGTLPVDKTSVKLFDIEGLACPDIERVLLNSVMTCGTPGETQPDCTALTAPSSRTEAAFIK
jgi:hypothetical protein